MLSAAQVATFRREGVLVLPAFVDDKKCEVVRRQMWAATASALPQLRREDPSTFLRPAQRSPGNGIDHGPSGICPHLCWFTDEENVNLCVAQGAAPPPHGGDAPAFPTSYPLTDEY